MWTGIHGMLILIVLTLVAAVVVIVLYQGLIQKYYWGPNGPPQKKDQNKDLRQR
jgi:hypothetical protein